MTLLNFGYGVRIHYAQIRTLFMFFFSCTVFGGYLRSEVNAGFCPGNASYRKGRDSLCLLSQETAWSVVKRETSNAKWNARHIQTYTCKCLYLADANDRLIRNSHAAIGCMRITNQPIICVR